VKPGRILSALIVAYRLGLKSGDELVERLRRERDEARAERDRAEEERKFEARCAKQGWERVGQVERELATFRARDEPEGDA
jgi:hypothetical protein